MNKKEAITIRQKKRFHSELLSTFVLIILALAARSSLADHYYVPSGSMEYSLLPGDRVVVDKRAYGLRVPFTKIDFHTTGSPHPGDIAVFDSPKDGTLLIKRIVAVGGDFVQLRTGRLWINGIPRGAAPKSSLENYGTHVARLNLSHGGGPDIHGLRIPEKTVLALGDHRGNSLDGRFFGLIPERELYGRAIRLYYRRDEGFLWQKL